MGLINYTNIEDGSDASANTLNQRFGDIVGMINGNLDTQNLKNFAVTREKIAPASISSDKLLVDRYVDEFGWTVSDFGTYKRYSKSGTISQTIPGNAFQYITTGVSLPLGTSMADVVGSFLAVTDQAISIGFNTNASNITFNVQNKYGSPAPCNGSWNLTLER